jgi:hypothetical protein
MRTPKDLRAERQGELGFARELISNEALTLHFRDPETLVELGEDNLHDEGVARNDGTTELDAVDPSEEELLLGTASACIMRQNRDHVSRSSLFVRAATMRRFVDASH